MPSAENLAKARAVVLQHYEGPSAHGNALAYYIAEALEEAEIAAGKVLKEERARGAAVVRVARTLSLAVLRDKTQPEAAVPITELIQARDQVDAACAAWEAH